MFKRFETRETVPESTYLLLQLVVGEKQRHDLRVTQTKKDPAA